MFISLISLNISNSIYKMNIFNFHLEILHLT